MCCDVFGCSRILLLSFSPLPLAGGEEKSFKGGEKFEGDGAEGLDGVVVVRESTVKRDKASIPSKLLFGLKG